MIFKVRRKGATVMCAKTEFYGHKKIIFICILLGMLLLFGVGVLIYTVVSRRWDFVAICFGFASMFLLVLLWLVNLSVDVTLDYEKRTVLSNVPFRKQGIFEVVFDEIQSVEILSSRELGKIYQGKRLPKQALCLYLNRQQVKVISGTLFSNRQMVLLSEQIKAAVEDCR